MVLSKAALLLKKVGQPYQFFTCLLLYLAVTLLPLYDAQRPRIAEDGHLENHSFMRALLLFYILYLNLTRHPL